MFNIAKSESLQRRLLSGSLVPASLVAMAPSELAPDADALRRREAKQAAIDASTYVLELQLTRKSGGSKNDYFGGPSEEILPERSQSQDMQNSFAEVGLCVVDAATPSKGCCNEGQAALTEAGTTSRTVAAALNACSQEIRSKVISSRLVCDDKSNAVSSTEVLQGLARGRAAAMQKQQTAIVRESRRKKDAVEAARPMLQRYWDRRGEKEEFKAVLRRAVHMLLRDYLDIPWEPALLKRVVRECLG